MQLDEAALDISPQVILNGTDSKTNPYYMNMVKLAVTLGADKAKAEAELLESFKFEKELTSVNDNLMLFNILLINDNF